MLHVGEWAGENGYLLSVTENILKSAVDKSKESKAKLIVRLRIDTSQVAPPEEAEQGRGKRIRNQFNFLITN